MKQAILTRTFIIDAPDEFFNDHLAARDELDEEYTESDMRNWLCGLDSVILEEHAANDYKLATLCEFIEIPDEEDADEEDL